MFFRARPVPGEEAASPVGSLMKVEINEAKQLSARIKKERARAYIRNTLGNVVIVFANITLVPNFALS